MGGLVLGPFFGPSGDGAAVMIIADPKARVRYGVAGVAMPKETLGGGAQDFFDNHSHAVVAEGVSLAEAKRLGEAWAKKFRKGLVLAPCACEDMVDAVGVSCVEVDLFGTPGESGWPKGITAIDTTMSRARRVR
jgi:hypothetical protein